MNHYIAIIHKDKDSDFGVSFPDLPGCISAGRTLEEARLMAIEALEVHITYMIEEGFPIPEPSSLDAVIQHEDYEGAVAVLPVPLEIEQRIQRVNISVPERDLARIDRHVSHHGLNRSQFLVRSALNAIHLEETLQEQSTPERGTAKIIQMTIEKSYQTKLGTTTASDGWDTQLVSHYAGGVQ